MTELAIFLVVLAAALFFFGVFVEAVKFLIWVAIALAVVAVIVWLYRYIRGSRSGV